LVENLFLEFLVHEFLSLLLVKHNGFALLSHSGSSKRLRLGVDPINLTFDLFLKKEKQIKIHLIKKNGFFMAHLRTGLGLACRQVDLLGGSGQKPVNI
jgi:hypothetical protein